MSLNTSSFLRVGKIWDIAKNPDQFEWKRLRDGMSIHSLYKTDAGPSAALIRIDPGVTIPKHFHTGYEHIIVLEGFLSDKYGNQNPGDLLVNQPGTSHEVFTETGAIVLGIWEKPIQFEVHV